MEERDSFNLFTELRTSSRSYYNISNYVFDISPPANCSILCNETFKCNELYSQKEYEITIQKFNYSENTIMYDTLFIYRQGMIIIYFMILFILM